MMRLLDHRGDSLTVSEYGTVDTGSDDSLEVEFQKFLISFVENVSLAAGQKSLSHGRAGAADESSAPSK